MLLDRYLGRAVIAGIAVTALVFAGLFLFIDFARQLKTVGTADYDALTALYYVLLMLPQRLFQLAPSVILVGTLLSLGAMAASSELTVMRTAGCSIMRITRSVLQAGLLVIVVVVLLGEFVAPLGIKQAQALRVQALNQSVLVGGGQGLWLRDGARYINVRKIMPDRQLYDVYLYETGPSRQLQAVHHIRHAQPGGAGWLLHDIVSSEISADGVASRSRQTQTTDTLVRASLFDVLKSDPEEMSVRDLYQYTQYLQNNQLEADSYRLQLWVKLLTPLTCAAMLLLALPLVFGAQARTGGAGQRVVIGLSIGIVFYVLNRLVSHLGLVYGAPPALSAALPPVLAVTLALYWLRRV